MSSPFLEILINKAKMKLEFGKQKLKSENQYYIFRKRTEDK